MRANLLNALMLTCAVTFAGGACAQSNDDFVAKAKANLTHSFHDPSAAQFRNLYISESAGDRILCGEVNGKNAYGGYVGFRAFYASPTIVPWISDRDASYASMNDPAMSRCQHKVADVQ